MKENRPVDLTRFVRDIPNFPKRGVVFKDITPLVGDGPAFGRCIDLLAQVGRRHKIDKVVAVESRGFIFGSAVAHRLGVGVVPVRKKGKLPHKTFSATYALEYGRDTLEMHVDGLRPGERVFLVDDVLATGGTAEAVVRLVTRAGGTPLAAAFAVELLFLKGRDRLLGVSKIREGREGPRKKIPSGSSGLFRPAGFEVVSLIRYR